MKCHQRTPPHTHSLDVSLSLLHRHTHQLGENRVRLAVVMKDSDEGEAVKHSVDVIHLVIERTHHTGRLSFKSILFQHEPGVDQDQSKHHVIHVWMNTTTQYPFQYISVPLHEENPSKKVNRATGWLIILIPHMRYYVPYKKNHQDQVKGFEPNCNSKTILKYSQPLWDVPRLCRTHWNCSKKEISFFLEQDHRCPRKYVRWGGKVSTDTCWELSLGHVVQVAQCCFEQKGVRP